MCIDMKEVFVKAIEIILLIFFPEGNEMKFGNLFIIVDALYNGTELCFLTFLKYG